MNGSGTIGGYEDIHGNLRFWIARLLDAAGPGSRVIYDIGSNDGELTLPLCRPPSRVIAFEPVPASRERLERRATDQGIMTGESRCLTVVPCALGSTAGSATIEIYSDDTFSSFFGRPPEDLQRYNLSVTGTVQVPVLALDALTGLSGDRVRHEAQAMLPAEVALPLKPPDIVKIDVEGAEREVLTGAIETLRRFAPAVIMEYSCVNTENAGYPRENLMKLLNDAGYDHVYGLYRAEDRTLYHGTALESCRIWNVLAVPPRFSGAAAGAEIGTILPD